MRLLPLVLLPLLFTPTLADQPASDAELCHAQLALLLRGEKLTAEEEATFRAQCDCLSQQQQTGAQDSASCAQRR